jgi:hypothetical protein
MLATAMHSQPGVYAVLLGSGISTDAGIPTGWAVVRDLVGRIAAAAHPGDESVRAEATADPEAWWAAHGSGDLGYSSLLAALAPTPATRQALLAKYFEQSEEDRDQGLKTPTAAHLAIANLVKRGSVRVVLTTNFDRLMERALDAVGISPQVIATPGATEGMTPLPHAQATVVKLHGDYADLGMLNTVEELETYAPEWDSLLDRIFDEYGLIVAGWSGAWDTALRASLERAPSRRYPLYWDGRSGRAEEAQRLLALRQGHLAGTDAQSLFSSLLASVEALDHLIEAPLTTAMATARLKRYLPDPVCRIDLHDLVMQAVENVRAGVHREPINVGNLTHERLQEAYATHLAVTTPLLTLLVEGVRHDAGLTHEDLWCEVLQRLLTVRERPTGQHQEPLVIAQHYPALLAFQTMSVVAIARDREHLLTRMATGEWWTDPYNRERRSPTAQVLHMQRVLDHVGDFPRWGGTRWYYPASHMLREDLREVLRPLLPADDDYREAIDEFEYRVGLIQEQQQDASIAFRANSGEFVGEGAWVYDGGPRAEVSFRRVADGADLDWPWWPVLGGPDNLDQRLLDYRETLKRYQRFG